MMFHQFDSCSDDLLTKESSDARNHRYPPPPNYRTFPKFKKIYKIGSSSIRKTTGYTEFFSGLIFIFLPEQNYYCKILKSLSTAFLALVMGVNTYLHYHIERDSKLPVYSYAIFLGGVKVRRNGHGPWATP